MKAKLIFDLPDDAEALWECSNVKNIVLAVVCAEGRIRRLLKDEDIGEEAPGLKQALRVLHDELAARHMLRLLEE